MNKLAEWLNRVVCMDCVEGMKHLPDACADLFVFSPPYDSIRTYGSKPDFDLHAVGVQALRLLKDGGMCVMVIQDQTSNFAKSLTSFKTIVDWCENVGFRLFECCIYRKNGTEGAWWKNRFRVDHEYIPLFLKGERPAYFNKQPLMVPTKHGGKLMSGFATRNSDGTTNKTVRKHINSTKCRGTIWDYLNAGDKNKLKHKHPATFPDRIPYDLIQCFCPPGGLVIDPFIGSASTACGAVRLDRRFIGFDISQEYCDLADQRILEVRCEIIDDVVKAERIVMKEEKKLALVEAKKDRAERKQSLDLKWQRDLKRAEKLAQEPRPPKQIKKKSR